MRSPQLLATGSTSINMTPMIDVVFLLIIFFLVSSHLAKQEHALPLDLPKATSGLDEQVERDTVVVNILPSGELSVSGAVTNPNQLKSLLQREAKNTPLRLKIRTDETVAYKHIEPVLKAANQVGVGDIVFSVYEDR